MHHFFESATALVVFILSGLLAMSGWMTTQLEPTISTYLSSSSAYIERILSIQQENQQEQSASVAHTETGSTVSKEQISQALVNVYCTHTEGAARHVSTGSGVLVDAGGIALTSAHVIEGLLREDTQNASCVFRTGTSTVQIYETELLYAPAAWKARNITHSNGIPLGTGEHDFALLRVVDATENVPERFPFLDISTMPMDMRLVEAELYAGGYARGTITNESSTSLNQRIKQVRVTHFYTFSSGHIDLIAVNDLDGFGAGASGGPVVDASGSIRGITTTLGNERIDGAESMRALTLPYIDRIIRAETGAGLKELISEVSEDPAN